MISTHSVYDAITHIQLMLIVQYKPETTYVCLQCCHTCEVQEFIVSKICETI